MNLIQWFSLAGICTRKAGSGGKTHAFCPGRAAAVNEGTSEKSPRTAATTQATKPTRFGAVNEGTSEKSPEAIFPIEEGVGL